MITVYELQSVLVNSNLSNIDIDNIELTTNNGNGTRTFTLNKGFYAFTIDTAANQGVNVSANSYKILLTETSDRQQIIIVEVTNDSETVTMTPNYTGDYWTSRYFKIL